jgi:glycosyltransferase involved in cell wall biosynthesis
MVSVIIPMYNAESTIKTCIDSVLKQTYKGKVEIIVVNDGSKDNSHVIVEELIRTNNANINIQLINKENGGVSSARNIGIYSARGEYIALLDADDRWLERKLDVQMEILKSNTQIDFIGCSRNNEELKIFGKKIGTLHKATVKELLVKMYPQTSTAVFKRILFEQFGGYNENMTHAEDGELWLRYCANANFYCIPDSLVITGDGKPHFGHSGLSANLEAMHKGNLFILKEAFNERKIGFISYSLFFVFYEIKYLRRVLLTKNR